MQFCGCCNSYYTTARAALLLDFTDIVASCLSSLSAAVVVTLRIRYGENVIIKEDYSLFRDKSYFSLF